MSLLKTVTAGLAFVALSVHAAETSADDMGPAAFMWPPDRVWSAAMDNTAPCGSVAGVTNRTDFPMKNGKVALVGQDESYDIELSVSYLESPKSNSDFSTLIDADSFKSIDPGHTCVSVDDAPSSVKAGANATLQIKYIANWDTPENETFYACADIQYVELSDFKESIPCFNATQPADDDDDDDDSSSDESSSPSATATSTPKKGGSDGLSGGAIAGIVVGSVAGVALIALAALLLYRRKSQKLANLRQQHSARGVNWEQQPPKDTASAGSDSVRMGNLNH